MEYIDWNTKKIINPPYTVTYSGPSTTTEIQEVVTGQDENGNDIIEEQYVDVVIDITEDIVLESYMFTESNNDYLKGYDIYPVDDSLTKFNSNIYFSENTNMEFDSNTNTVILKPVLKYKELSLIKDYLILKVNNTLNSSVKSVIDSDVDSYEMDTWEKQLSEAKEYKLDNQTNTPFIDGILSKRSLYSKNELVDKIISKADAYTIVLGKLIGEKQNKIDIIKGCNTIDELISIDSSILPELKEN